MADKTDAWMPLWIGAYLADTQHLNRDEHGGYFLLLMAYWRARAALPDDDKRLASIVKAAPAEWRRIRPTLAEFFKVENGTWWHKRVEAEISAADKRKAGAVSKAKAAAGARWGHTNTDAPSIPQAMHEQCPTPSSTSLPSEEKTARKRASGFDASRIELPDWLDAELWSDWVKDRAERGKRITERGAQQQLATLDEFRRAGHTPERTIRHAIASGNQGLFPPPRLKADVVRQTVPSRESEEERQRRLEADRMTPEQKIAADKAAKLALSAIKNITPRMAA